MDSHIFRKAAARLPALADLAVAPATTGGTHQIDMGLNTVPTGEYLIEITATGAAGDVKQLIALRVAS